MSACDASYDRAAELRALDATFAGVRGLVASGVTHLPRIFRVPQDVHHHEPRQDIIPAGVQQEPATTAIPVIDLGCDDRAAVVAAVGRAAAKWGFFQVTGHGVPQESMAAALDAARAFHESSGGEGSDKALLYTRDPDMPVKYNCNLDLHQSKVANWRDTLYVHVAPGPPAAADLPDSCCIDVILDYAKHEQEILCHYYPPCPEPEVAIGTTQHTDAVFLNVLLQDGVGGLQVLHKSRWIDVEPIPGAFIVNIGDLMQIISNGKFRSVEHRAIAKNAAPRVSIACFPSNPSSTRVYGPIKEQLSEENPPLYRETLIKDYFAHFTSVGLGTKKAINDFRL